MESLHGRSSHGVILEARTFDDKLLKVSIQREVAFGASAKIFVAAVVVGEVPSRLVAVKLFNNIIGGHQQVLLERELLIAREVSVGRHPLILPFIGTGSVGVQTAIVSQYMKNGNLREYLEASKAFLNVDKKTLILQVAEAVNYLHTVAKMVHGDLKCANVLVSDAGDALLADFGLSTFVEKSQTSSTTAFSIRQMFSAQFAAPELLTDDAGRTDDAGGPGRVRSKTRESDVYAFGMLVLEAVTERSPWDGVNIFAVMSHVISGKRPPRPPVTQEVRTNISGEWWNTCLSCWNEVPGDRPAIGIIQYRLAKHAYNVDRVDMRYDDPYDPELMSAMLCPAPEREQHSSELEAAYPGVLRPDEKAFEVPVGYKALVSAQSNSSLLQRVQLSMHLRSSDGYTLVDGPPGRTFFLEGSGEGRDMGDPHSPTKAARVCVLDGPGWLVIKTSHARAHGGGTQFFDSTSKLLSVEPTPGGARIMVGAEDESNVDTDTDIDFDSTVVKIVVEVA